MSDDNWIDNVEWSGWPLSDAKTNRDDPQRADAGFLYVVEFSDGIIKVGRSQGVRTRMQKHQDDAWWRDSHIIRAFISKPHADWRDTEGVLIRYCARRCSEQIAKEYFRGLDFAKVVSRVRRIPQHLEPLEVIERRHREAQEELDVWRARRNAGASYARRQVFASGMRHAAEIAEALISRLPAGMPIDGASLVSALLLAADCFSGDCLHEEGEDGHAYLPDHDLQGSVEECLEAILPVTSRA